jgi:hypothetical protein
MKKYIVTTTINPPTKALKLFAQKKDWNLIIAGDLITPHLEFKKLEKKYNNVRYLDPEYQEKRYSKLSKVLGWRNIQRRNIGLLEAYLEGAEIIATVDDDNIPTDEWGRDLFLGKKVEVNYYRTSLESFDPVGATNYPNLWHRGYPLQLLARRNYSEMTKKVIIPYIQADFWNGDPDIDAICRMQFAPDCRFDTKFFPLSSNKISPFNSQNTFLSRKVMKDYFLFPFVGRMDDIWASFYVQSKGYKVVYGKPTVYQERNPHDLTKDMVAEFLGYEKSLEIIKSIQENSNSIFKFLPKESVKSFEIYSSYF